MTMNYEIQQWKENHYPCKFFRMSEGAQLKALEQCDNNDFELIVASNDTWTPAGCLVRRHVMDFIIEHDKVDFFSILIKYEPMYYDLARRAPKLGFLMKMKMRVGIGLKVWEETLEPSCVNFLSDTDRSKINRHIILA